MILLTGTSDLLNVLTGGAQSVDWNCSWNDMNYTAGTFLPGSAEGNIAAATTTNLVGAPAGSVQRQIKFLSLTNKDATNAVALTIIKSSGGTSYNLTGAWSIPAGWTLYYLDGQGFVVQNGAGAIQYVGSVGATGASGAQGTPGVATYLEADPGEQGDQGFPGPIGPTGLTGSQGPVGPATYLEADATEGDIGPPGVQGPQGITGAQGPTGPPIYLDADAGDQGDQGFPGQTGATGPQGLQGIQGDQGDTGEDGVPIPGNQGLQGNTGPQGAIGPQGLQGIQGDQGDAGDDGVPIPGNQGATGPTGLTGTQGPQGYQGIQGDQGDAGDDGQPLPGPQGIQGPTGATGAQGSQGFIGPQGDTGDPGDDGVPIPGNQGVTGPMGPTGAQGPQGPVDNMLWLESDRDDENWQATSLAGVASVYLAPIITNLGSAPGNDPHAMWLEADRDQEVWPQQPSGPTAQQLDPSAGGLSASTTIASTTTQTTGGITLQVPAAVAGQVYRVRAYGQFVAVSSATARNAGVAVFWGSVASSALQVTVLASTAQTTNWRLEFDLTVTSPTAVWVSGFFQGSTASTTNIAVTRQTPASITVTAGVQSIDLRFNMSAVVSGDSWTIDQVTIERLK